MYRSGVHDFLARPVLERLQVAGDRWLANPKNTSGLRHILGFRHSHEGLQPAQAQRVDSQ